MPLFLRVLFLSLVHIALSQPREWAWMGRCSDAEVEGGTCATFPAFSDLTVDVWDCHMMGQSGKGHLRVLAPLNLLLHSSWIAT